MKKKTVSILLMAAMALSLAACGFSNSTDSSSKSSSKAESCIQRFFGSRERIQRQEHSRRRSI